MSTFTEEGGHGWVRRPSHLSLCSPHRPSVRREEDTHLLWLHCPSLSGSGIFSAFPVARGPPHTPPGSRTARGAQLRAESPGLSPAPFPKPQFLYPLITRRGPQPVDHLCKHWGKVPFPLSGCCPSMSRGWTGEPSRQVPLGNAQGGSGFCSPGAKPGTTISLSPALTSHPQPDLDPGVLPAPVPLQPLALPIRPWPPTMTLLSRGLFFPWFRCLLGVGTTARGAGCGVGEKFHPTPHPVYALSETTVTDGSSLSFLPLICWDLPGFTVAQTGVQVLPDCVALAK